MLKALKALKVEEGEAAVAAACKLERILQRNYVLGLQGIVREVEAAAVAC